MSVINLTKGSNVNLSKTVAGAQRFVIGLGWNPNPSNPPDLDAAAYPCKNNASGDPELLTPGQENVIYFGNLKSADGAIVHGGDNLTGDGDGDDERILIDTSSLNAVIEQIIIGVAIYQAAQKGQTFGLVRNAYVRIYDASALEAAEGRAWNAKAQPGDKLLTDAELKALSVANYDLEEDAGGYTALHFGTFYKKDGEWRFKALGVGANGDLNSFAELLAPKP